MQDVLVKWLLELIFRKLAEALTPEQIKQWETLLVNVLRNLAKTKTPDFPWDDRLVELLAAALQVP